ncbi:MAG: hypothetical protein GY801_28235, partial [bacterium]|nr:hypothetical protein [bacterium]
MTNTEDIAVNEQKLNCDYSQGDSHMNSRERIRRIIAGQPADRCGFWLGNPDKDTWPIYHEYFGTTTEEELRLKLGDDVRWICPQFFDSTYRHPEGKGMFDLALNKLTKDQPAPPLADCETVEGVEQFDWPNPDYLNFEECIAALSSAGEFYRASGFWTCFYHNLMDLFGMENYMMKMLLNPEVIHAATDKVCEFYYQANERVYEEAGDLIDAYFFGNDFGTQLDLICGLDQLDEFIFPWFDKFVAQAHRHGYQVILHSCGSIYRVIDRLIALGVDCLHPLQAKATNMEAETLAREFKDRISFMGGIDTQDLLVNGSPDEIEADVRRVKAALDPRLIVSPSHEAVLPNVPPENVE